MDLFLVRRLDSRRRRARVDATPAATRRVSRGAARLGPVRRTACRRGGCGPGQLAGNCSGRTEPRVHIETHEAPRDLRLIERVPYRCGQRIRQRRRCLGREDPNLESGPELWHREWEPKRSVITYRLIADPLPARASCPVPRSSNESAVAWRGTVPRELSEPVGSAGIAHPRLEISSATRPHTAA